MTSLLARFKKLATAAHLPDPLGRAAALVNRVYNRGGFYGYTDEEYVAHMRTFKPGTAERWRTHYLAGGSLKKLGASRAEQLAERREYERRIRAGIA